VTIKIIGLRIVSKDAWAAAVAFSALMVLSAASSLRHYCCSVSILHGGTIEYMYVCFLILLKRMCALH